MKYIFNLLFTALLALFVITILTLTIRGIPGNPTEDNMNDPKWFEEGPFELSPDRGRFALLYSYVENHSFQYSLPVARFALPDLAYYKGAYVSLFPPGVSFTVIPGYLLGKQFNLAQVGTFATISFLAFCNFFWIIAIAKRLGANPWAATLGAIAFLFASPAFAYAVSLYQHHIAVFLILSAIYVVVRWQGIWTVAAVGFLTALSIPIDNPNVVFMVPIAIYSMGRLFIFEETEKSYKIRVKLLSVVVALIAVIPLLFYFQFNKLSNGSYMQLSGTLPGVRAIDDQGMPAVPVQVMAEEDQESAKKKEAALLNPELQKKSAGKFFKSRNMLNGIYVHMISPDRGIIYFTPILLLGLLALPWIRKKEHGIVALLLAVIGSNIILYSMWGDPWGGWGFGSRYLIPSYAVLSILLAIMLTRIRRNILIVLIVVPVMIYSIGVNTLGAVTTNRNPHEGEARALSEISNRIEKFSYDRNWDYLNANRSKSYLFQTHFQKNMSAFEYYRIITIAISGVVIICVIGSALHPARKEKS